MSIGSSNKYNLPMGPTGAVGVTGYGGAAPGPVGSTYAPLFTNNIPNGITGTFGLPYVGEEIEVKVKDKIGTLVKEDLDEIFKNRRSSLYVLPAVSRSVLTTAQKLDCWLGGGAALALYTGEIDKIKDWDLFFKSPQLLSVAKDEYIKQGFNETITSDWSISLEMSGVIVQLVTRHYYNETEDIFRKFDFTICCFAVRGNDIYYTEMAKEDLNKKEFNFIYTENLPTCIKRIARYGAKGFMPSSQFTQDITNTFKKTPTSKIRKMKGSGQS